MKYKEKQELRYIFKNFKKKHSRAIEIFENVYGVTDDILISKYCRKTKEDPTFRRWYFLKQAIKFLESISDTENNYTNDKYKELIAGYCEENGYTNT